MPHEKVRTVKAIIVELECECGASLKFSHMFLEDDDPWEHYCPRCGKVERKDQRYPYVKHIYAEDKQ